MQQHKKNEKCLVDIWNYKTKSIDQEKGTVLSIATALDREYRVNVLLDNGKEISQAAPECVHTLNN